MSLVGGGGGSFSRSSTRGGGDMRRVLNLVFALVVRRPRLLFGCVCARECTSMCHLPSARTSRCRVQKGTPTTVEIFQLPINSQDQSSEKHSSSVSPSVTKPQQLSWIFLLTKTENQNHIKMYKFVSWSSKCPEEWSQNASQWRE